MADDFGYYKEEKRGDPEYYESEVTSHSENNDRVNYYSNDSYGYNEEYNRNFNNGGEMEREHFSEEGRPADRFYSADQDHQSFVDDDDDYKSYNDHSHDYNNHHDSDK